MPHLKLGFGYKVPRFSPFSCFLNKKGDKLKIGRDRVLLKPLKDHVCPDCGEKVERMRRRFWQKLVSFAVPFRHYRCTNCYHEFFALSPSWKKMPRTERVLRLLATGLVMLVTIYVGFRILAMILYSIFS